MQNARSLMILSILTLSLIGCKPAEEKAEPRQGPPEQYIRASLGAGEHAKAMLGTTVIQKAIDMFQLQEGRFPSSLTELQKEGFLSETPAAPVGKKFSYDATTGKVTIVDK